MRKPENQKMCDLCGYSGDAKMFLSECAYLLPVKCIDGWIRDLSITLMCLNCYHELAAWTMDLINTENAVPARKQ